MLPNALQPCVQISGLISWDISDSEVGENDKLDLTTAARWSIR